MKREITFHIRFKDTTINTTAYVDVPENWDNMPEDDQREYLIKPVSKHHHRGRILYTASRFQNATGIDDDVIDFIFSSSEP